MSFCVCWQGQRYRHAGKVVEQKCESRFVSRHRSCCINCSEKLMCVRVLVGDECGRSGGRRSKHPAPSVLQPVQPTDGRHLLGSDHYKLRTLSPISHLYSAERCCKTGGEDSSSLLRRYHEVNMPIKCCRKSPELRVDMCAVFSVSCSSGLSKVPAKKFHPPPFILNGRAHASQCRQQVFSPSRKTTCTISVRMMFH